MSHFYRPQTKVAKVMFSQVFVCHQGRVSVSVLGVSVLVGPCPRGLCPGILSMESLSKRSLSRIQGSLSGGSLSRGFLSAGSLSGRPPDSPPYCNEQAVRIVLECILVICQISKIWKKCLPRKTQKMVALQNVIYFTGLECVRDPP